MLAVAGQADANVRLANLEEADSLYRELIDLERNERDLSQRALVHLAELVKIKIRRGIESDADEAVSALFSRLSDRTKSVDADVVRQLLLNLTDFAVDHGKSTVAIRLLERALRLKMCRPPRRRPRHFIRCCCCSIRKPVASWKRDAC